MSKPVVADALEAIRRLTEERDEAKAHAERAWAAATDEKVVGFHREMALRLSEDRDVLKHRCRTLEGQLAALTPALRTLRETFARYDAGEWDDPTPLDAVLDAARALLALVPEAPTP